MRDKGTTSLQHTQRKEQGTETIYKKKCDRTCAVQIKAVPLHPLLRNTRRLNGGFSSVGRASDCGSECRGFEPHTPPKR